MNKIEMLVEMLMDGDLFAFIDWMQENSVLSKYAYYSPVWSVWAHRLTDEMFEIDVNTTFEYLTISVGEMIEGSFSSVTFYAKSGELSIADFQF